MKRSKRLELFVLLTDMIALSISYALSAILYLTVLSENSLFLEQSFLQSFVLLLVSIMFTNFFTLSKNRMFLKRSKTQELYNVIKNDAFIIISFATSAFIFGYSEYVSRGVLAMTAIMYFFVDYGARLLLRKFYAKLVNKNSHKLLVVTTYSNATSTEFVDGLKNGNSTEIIGFAIIDKDCVGETINEYNVVTDLKKLTHYSKLEIVDSVLVIVDNGWVDSLIPLIEELQSMGIVVHFGVDVIKKFAYFNTYIDFVGSFPVLTYSESLPSEETLIIKRGIDIFAGIIGSCFTLVVALILGPIIKIESPGPIFFKQRRVGKNGRYFYIYKFRSMGVDAEARKKDLMSQNEVDGHMFKMTNDPRVTKVGKFIRATSIDELPQFFNVLKGDMSLVGTRPPTVEEFKQYKAHHKRRLSMKPGITGMWQVSGRSNITDFEEVVRLDTEYIDSYTLALDFKIIAKTFIVVFAKVGSK